MVDLMPTTPPAFCKTCKYYHGFVAYIEGTRASCNHPDHIEQKITPIERKPMMGDCFTYNKDNSCTKYKEGVDDGSGE